MAPWWVNANVTSTWYICIGADASSSRRRRDRGHMAEQEQLSGDPPSTDLHRWPAGTWSHLQ